MVMVMEEMVTLLGDDEVIYAVISLMEPMMGKALQSMHHHRVVL